MPVRHAQSVRLIRVAVLAAACLFTASAAASDETPLHVRIDELMSQRTPDAAAPVASDAEFLRRVSLDLIGVPPTAAKVRAFLADESPDKRAAAVDRLLASPLYARHMAGVFDVMLMERRGNQHIPQDDWQAYLLQSVRDNKPYHVLAREILAADGTNEEGQVRAAVRFYLDRGSEPNVITRDVGRIFFGRDLQCAQCHDHPLIDDYLQSDYHGLLAFFAPGHELKIKEGDAEVAYYAERAGSELEFESVFIKGTKHLTGPRVPGGVQLDEPDFPPGEEYEVAPAENVRPVPRFSRRAQLAELAASGSNRAFNENIANRLWAHMFGRGLVHPVDLHHSSNPPSHPELLTLLGERFAAMGFDVKAFLRELALTEVYQRAIDLPEDLPAHADAAAPLVAELEAAREPLAARSDESLAAYFEAFDAWNAAGQALLPAVDALQQARSTYTEAQQKVGETTAALAAAEAELEAKRQVTQSVQAAADQAQAALEQVGEDAELAAAAQTFADRAAALQTEVAALTQAAEEKRAALQPLTDAFNAARSTLDAAQQAVTPLQAAVREAEQVMVAARQIMMQDYAALMHHDRRLSSVKLLAEISALENAAAASSQAIASRESELATARRQVSEYASVVTGHEGSLQAAQSRKAETADALAAVQQEHAERTETAASVAAAHASTATALERLPDDAALQSAAATLKAKSEELAAAVTEHQQQVDAAAAADEAAAQAVTQAQQALDAARAEMTRRQQTVAAAETALAEARSQAQSDRAAVDEALAELTDRWAADFTIAPLKPLTPEQMCWSMLRVTGVYERTRQAKAAELENSNPLSEEARQDPAQVAAREREIEQLTYEALKGNVGTFVSIYGAAAGQPQTDFFATADQALFAANGGAVNGWVAPAGGNVTERIIQAETPQQAAEELYLAVLSRMPTEQETRNVTDYLADRTDDRNAAAAELVWSLLTSAEFRFSH